MIPVFLYHTHLRYWQTSPLPVLDGVVGSLFGDHHVVGVALAQAGAGDANEARLFLHLLDGGAAGIAHRLAQAADQLVDQRPQHAFVGYARLDTFGDEAALVDYVALEVAILAVAALLHSS